MRRGRRERARTDRTSGVVIVLARREDGERGSGPVEFVLVGTLLTAVTLAVLQLGIAVYVRNVVHDAAVDGAHVAALADTDDADGIRTAREAISRTVGAVYAEDISIAATTELGVPTVEVTVRSPLPVLGLVSIPFALEVTGRAPQESFDPE